MTLFHRRMTAKMLRELSPQMLPRARNHLAGRLDDHDVNTSIAAAWELATVWAMNKFLGAKTSLRSVTSKKNPDVEVDLQLERPIAIDIKSLSGDTFTFRNYLEKVTSDISTLWNTLKSDSVNSFDIRFHEKRSYGDPIPRRPATVLKPSDSPLFVEAIKKFLEGNKDSIRIQIPNVIFATIRKSTLANPNFTCDIPGYVQNISNSQSSNTISVARSQMLPFQDSHYIGLIICDGGNSIFSEPRRFTPLGQASTSKMIMHIVKEANLDFVVTVGFREVQQQPYGFISTGQFVYKNRQIALDMFADPTLPTATVEIIREDLFTALSNIPTPRMLPYQVKANLESIRRRPISKRIYLPTSSSQHMGESFMVRISSNALIDFLRGDLSPEDLLRKTGALANNGSLRGKKIMNVKFESLGDSYDDDYVVFELENDDTSKSFAEIVKSK